MGKLYIVGTPIGNLEDMTFRAIKTLKEVDLIAAEDTRHSLQLLNHFEIKKPLTSYHEHNKAEKGPYLIEQLLGGKNVAIVTDAGMPAISDPGEDLIKLCIENNIDITVVPGPTAFSSALVISGLPTKNFSFEGFLSAKKKERIAQLEKLKACTNTLLFYEAPHKLKRTLTDMLEVLGDRRIVICRELTKKFEEALRLSLSEAIEHFDKAEPRGEFVIVVQGAEEEETKEFELSANEQIDMLIESGMDKKEAISQVALMRGIPKREVYNGYLRKE